MQTSTQYADRAEKLVGDALTLIGSVDANTGYGYAQAVAEAQLAAAGVYATLSVAARPVSYGGAA